MDGTCSSQTVLEAVDAVEAKFRAKTFKKLNLNLVGQDCSLA